MRSSQTLWIVSLTALVACNTDRPPAGSQRAAVEQSAATPLEGTYWRLVELNGKAALVTRGERRAHLEFTRGSARVSGSTGCNRLSAPFTRDSAALRFGPAAMTRMACVEEWLNEQERAFVAALEATDRHEVAADTLTLFGPSGALARFVAGSATAAADTTAAVVKGSVPPTADTVRWRGTYVYLADAGRFTDCASGASFLVAQVGANITLERAYTAARTAPGAPLLVTLRGHLEERPAMEGDRREVHLVVDRFERAWPGAACSDRTGRPDS